MRPLPLFKPLAAKGVSSPDLVKKPVKPVLVSENEEPRHHSKALQELIDLLKDSRHSAFEKH